MFVVFVYAASSSAYGDTEVLPKTEEMSPNPLSPYALQKLVGERYCKLYYDLYGLETVSLRYFNVFGPDQDPHSEYSAVIPKFITKLLAKEPLTVYGDGEQSRDFTYVENVVEANLLALRAIEVLWERLQYRLWRAHHSEHANPSAGGNLSIKANVNYDPPPRLATYVTLWLILRGHARLLGYEPKVMVKEGLRRTVQAFITAGVQT